MGRASYKRLGDYIQQVDIRNIELKVETLLGVSNVKEFIPSIANTIGTDMSNYKIVTKGQFVYGTVTSRNGDKLSIALMQEEEAIVSQAYTVFEVVDKTELLPDYLMMWFRRPEFDRYARFKSHGSAREIFDWEKMCEVRLPIPDIEEQREIVAQYEAITRRIALNERICANLEETAQALYNKMFVQGIDPDNLPDGWRMGTLDEIAEYLNGLACQQYESFTADYLPVIKIKELRQGFTDTDSSKVVPNVPTKYIIKNGDVIFSWSATLFVDLWSGGKAVLNQHLFKVTSKEYPKWFYLLSTKHHIDRWTREISAKATSMGHIKREDLENAEVVIPSEELINNAKELFDPLIKELELRRRETLQCLSLQSLLLNRITV